MALILYLYAIPYCNDCVPDIHAVAGGRVSYSRSIDYESTLRLNGLHEIVKYKQFTVFLVRKLFRQTKFLQV